MWGRGASGLRVYSVGIGCFFDGTRGGAQV